MSTASIQSGLVSPSITPLKVKKRPAPFTIVAPAQSASSGVEAGVSNLRLTNSTDVLFLKQLSKQISDLNHSLSSSPRLTDQLCHQIEDITKQLVNPEQMKENVEQALDLLELNEQIEILYSKLQEKKCKQIEIAIDTLTISKAVLFKTSLLKKEANESLGAGGFGSVEHARIFGKSYAKKTIRKSKEKKLLEECKNTQKFTHPNLIKVVHLDQDAIYLEYAEHGTSLNAIKKGLFTSHIDFERFVYQVADGLDYMHQKGFIHKDIKPDNILVAEDLSAKICDFATVADVKTFSYSQDSLVETSIFSSPEHLRGELKPENCFKLDVWGFGLFLWNLLKNDELHSPFIDDSSPKGEIGEDFCMKVLVRDEPFTEKEIRSHLDLNKLSKLDPNGKIVRIICACLSLSPEQRPSMERIKKMLR